ncbi:unnamed protein product [Paramecium octaurelia]|uniref:Uncharacterized protein n=1 Tax=Paramecium octaurelia TaxID=43137 RepID=A0A8S1T674_PAROT|nr:unnamed protein product [Paramecium octaurelia]
MRVEGGYHLTKVVWNNQINKTSLKQNLKSRTLNQ